MNTKNKPNLEYTGKVNPPPNDEKPPYLPSDELKEMVKLAVLLERPLLLMGEPGCGKTKLASAIVYEWTQNNQALLQEHQLESWPFYPWYVKSTSRAKDGLYTYDAVARLRDTQLVESNYIDEEERQTIKEALKDKTQEKYIDFGPLGQAFQSSLPAVVLIDEIDKADIDFPNDLLLELDEKCFFIEETQPKQKIPDSEQNRPSPLVIITSNNEKDLPNAFLRRCLFHYLEPPNDGDLEKIIKAHFGNKLPSTKPILDAYQRILEATANTGGKQVSTSELLDWIKALIDSPQNLAELTKDPVPYIGVLLKTREERIRYQKSLQGKKP